LCVPNCLPLLNFEIDLKVIIIVWMLGESMGVGMGKNWMSGYSPRILNPGYLVIFYVLVVSTYLFYRWILIKEYWKLFDTCYSHRFASFLCVKMQAFEIKTTTLFMLSRRIFCWLNLIRFNCHCWEVVTRVCIFK